MAYRYFVFWLLSFPLFSQEVNIALTTNLIDIIENKELNPCKKGASLSHVKGNKNQFDLFILCQSLYEADIGFVPNFVFVPNARRALWLVKEGQADVVATPIRHGVDLQATVTTGKIVLSHSAYNVPRIYAFYATSDNEFVKSINELEQLVQLKAAVPSTWKYHILWLKALGMKYEFVHFSNLGKFIKVKRADVTLQQVRKGELDKRTLSGITMTPVGKFYIQSPSNSEHYVFTGANNKARSLVLAFNKGFEILNQNENIQNMSENIHLDLSLLESWLDISPKW